MWKTTVKVLVLREELGPLSEGQRSRPTTPGWVFAVSDQNSGYVPRTGLEAEEDLAQSMTVRWHQAERNTAAYNEAGRPDDARRLLGPENGGRARQ